MTTLLDLCPKMSFVYWKNITKVWINLHAFSYKKEIYCSILFLTMIINDIKRELLQLSVSLQLSFACCILQMAEEIEIVTTVKASVFLFQLFHVKSSNKP